MTPASPRPVAAVTPQAESWKGRTFAVCGLAAAGAMGLTAANLDWSGDIAMSAGQLAGMIAPLGIIGLVLWLAVGRTGHRS
jgi:hypothetical protein